MLGKQLTQAAAGAGGADPLYVDDVFSTYLYEGNNGGNKPINNGIDLDGEGGLVWIKNRDTSTWHHLVDSARPNFQALSSNSPDSVQSSADISSFDNDGFTIGSNNTGQINGSDDYVSWTFRKAPGFFDVVTYNGDGDPSTTIAHNLGCTPGMIIIKRTNTSGQWIVYHSGIGHSYKLLLNNDGYKTDMDNRITAADSSTFTPGSDGDTNGLNNTYVAYLFAEGNDADSAVFGTNGDEKIIKCGTYTGTSSRDEVDVGFEPQWVLIKRTNTPSDANWVIFDMMREWNAEGDSHSLSPNTNNSENTGAGVIHPTPTGFVAISNDDTQGGDGTNYVYVAIRRPHKPPTAGTDVLDIVSRAGTGSTAVVNTNIEPVDFVITKSTNQSNAPVALTRLLGNHTNALNSNSDSNTNIFGSSASFNPWDVQDGIRFSSDGDTNGGSAWTYINYFFRRAPGFFDVVTYGGTTPAQNVNHNLGVAPELMIVKVRSTSQHWAVYNGDLPGSGKFISLNNNWDGNNTNSSFWDSTAPTASVFRVGASNSYVNTVNEEYIAYLFASLDGISKVGTYNGTGNDVNVDCDFAAGARFVMIKRTDSTGDWYVFDSTRGIVAGDDPWIALNTNPAQAQVTYNDFIDPYTSGFTVTSSAPDALNASEGTYLFLAIA